MDFGVEVTEGINRFDRKILSPRLPNSHLQTSVQILGTINNNCNEFWQKVHMKYIK